MEADRDLCSPSAGDEEPDLGGCGSGGASTGMGTGAGGGGDRDRDLAFFDFLLFLLLVLATDCKYSSSSLTGDIPPGASLLT